MLWLAPPLTFALGLGMSWTSGNEDFGAGFRTHPFFEARAGYQFETAKADKFAVGLNVRVSHDTFSHYDVTNEFPQDIYELDTYDVGVFTELDMGRFVTATPWIGVHTARFDASYSRLVMDPITGRWDEESRTWESNRFFTGPALALGLSIGVNLFAREQYRFTLFASAQATPNADLPSPGIRSGYSYKPLSIGVAARF